MLHCPNKSSALYKALLKLNNKNDGLATYQYNLVSKLQDDGLLSLNRFKPESGKLEYTIPKVVDEKSIAKSFRGESPYAKNVKAFEELDKRITLADIDWIKIKETKNAYMVEILPRYNESGIQTTLFQTSKKSGYSESLEAGLEWAKKVFPNSDVKLVEGLIQDIARGSYNSVEDVISASKQFADKGTIKHEFGHKAFASLSEQEREALLEEGSKLFKIPRGGGKTITKFQQVDYQFKVVEKITNSISRVEKLWNQIKDKQVFWNKIQQELGIPKEQLELLKNSEGESIEQKITNFLANYSYTIEINTSKELVRRSNYGYLDVRQVYDYSLEKDVWAAVDIETDTPLKTFDTEQEAINYVKPEVDKNTQFYSNLTVPGGTNYTENEIATLAITPSIKGHAQFATDKGIGWFRADDGIGNQERINLDKEWEEAKRKGIVDSSDNKFASGEVEAMPNKTRRILEVQSDLFQKGRDLKLLNKIPNKIGNDGKEYIIKWSGGLDVLGVKEESGWKVYTKGKPTFSSFYLNDVARKDIPEDIKNYIKSFLNEENHFLQLLNKDNNWVTFFVKSIIQDSAKKGYEKVLFPSGNTASKVEGHTTLEEFKKQKENRIKELEEKRNFTIEESKFAVGGDLTPNVHSSKIKNKFKTRKEAEDFLNNSEAVGEEKLPTNWKVYDISDKIKNELEPITNEINQLKQELERVETEGFGALKPIYNFYENVVTNILNKTYGKENVKQVTDEYGNTWNEITLHEKDNQSIKFQSGKLEYSGDLAIEEKIMELMETSPDRIVAKSAIGKFFQKLKQFLRDVFNSRDKIGNFIKDVNEGRFSERKTQNVSKGVKFQKVEEDWNDNKGSAFEQQQRFFKRKIAELKKVLESNKFPKYSKEWLEKKKELNELELQVNEAVKYQSQDLFLQLGKEALEKIDSYIAGLERGTNPVNDRYMEYVIDTLDVWSDFEGLSDEVKALKRRAFPFIKKYNLEVAKSFAHNLDSITEEAIDSDNLDIRKWFNLGSRYIGSLSDSQNILGRTIGFVIKEAQNKYSAQNKKEREEIQEQVTSLFEYAKKAGIKPINVYDLFIQESNNTTVLVQEKLKDGTDNPNWDKVQNTPELKKFYEFYRQKMLEAQKRLPVKPGANFIPNIQGESIKLFLQDINPFKTKDVKEGTVVEEYLPEVVPLRYIKSIPADIKSKDLGNSLLLFVKQAHEYEQLSDVLPKVNILQEQIKNEQLPDGRIVPRKFIKDSTPGRTVSVEGKDSDLYLMTQTVKEMQVLKKMKLEQGSIQYAKNYDNDGNPIEVKYFDTTDFVDNLLRLNSLVRIGFAPITAASNAIFGDASNLIEAIGGRFFNVKELGQATDIFFKQTFNRDSALNQILEETNYLQSLDDYQNIEKGVGQLTREKMLEYAYGMQKAGEKYLQSRTLIAVMIRKGYITPKGEPTKDWIDISEKEKTRFINETQRLNQMIHGRYSQEEAATMYQNVIFRMVSQFRKWLPSAIERTVGKKQFDERLGKEVEGTFITFGNKVLGNWKNPYQAVENMILPLLSAKAAIKKGNLSELEVYNMRKMMVNILLGAATFLAYLLLHGGDDEEKKKWRKNPWIKTTLTLLNRVSGDLNLIYSPGSVVQMAGTGAPVLSLIDDMIGVVRFTFINGLIYQDWVYKTGSRKGDIKALSKLGSVTPGVKPVLDIKRLASDYSLEELR